MASKRIANVSLGEQLVRGRDRIEEKKNKFIDNVYGALIRGRDRLEKTDYQLSKTNSE